MDEPVRKDLPVVTLQYIPLLDSPAAVCMLEGVAMATIEELSQIAEVERS